ncbi:hypothetical protein [Paenibacillus sp. Leaf72]|uniref:hypothetical protein n=1 Tax=Paenibacillus sp. Leaf72 TaxID=1736234 RepID=UPI0006F45283|nr:hypothetical protein [Paenibacillus sp. Leaf72]KQN96842.1 hypothetical protein ASF12_22490 [Paenibacillus sp. Leaf72]
MGSDEMEDIRTSMDNLLMMKTLHDAGYNVKNMGMWISSYQFNIYTGGKDLFCDCLARIFGDCIFNEVTSDRYRYFTLTCQTEDISIISSMFDPMWLNKILNPYKIQYCDFGSGELIMKIENDSIIFEIHESIYYYGQFLQKILQLAQTIDQLLVLAMPVYWKEQKKNDKLPS